MIEFEGFEGIEFSQKELEIILGISKPQAWRIYTGKSKLTESNKRLIKLHFENLDIKYKALEEKSKEWCESESFGLQGGYVSWGFSISSGKSECFIYVVNDESDVEYINDINEAIRNAKTDSLSDILMSMASEELENHIYKKTVISI